MQNQFFMKTPPPSVTAFFVATLLFLNNCEAQTTTIKKAAPKPVAATPAPKPTQTTDYDTKQWTEVRFLDTSIVLDLRYATTNNFVKTQMYDCARCFLRPEAAAGIQKAHQFLRKKGYGGLKMLDCYRPRPVQQKLWDKMPDANYVTPPAKGSMHNRGLAVDLTVIDKNGNELDMGTPFDDFSEKAHFDYTKLPKQILENRRLLRSAMEQAGFKGIRTEWWHFSYNAKMYNVSDWLWKCK